MTNDEIGKAMGYACGMICFPAHNKLSALAVSSLQPLITLAEEYLKVEGWPKEKIMDAYVEFGCEPPYDAYAKERGFNEALRLCKLAAMKEKNRLSEGIRNIISQPIDRISEITVESYEQIRQKLLELINGKEA